MEKTINCDVWKKKEKLLFFPRFKCGENYGRLMKKGKENICLLYTSNPPQRMVLYQQCAQQQNSQPQDRDNRRHPISGLLKFDIGNTSAFGAEIFPFRAQQPSFPETQLFSAVRTPRKPPSGLVHDAIPPIPAPADRLANIRCV